MFHWTKTISCTEVSRLFCSLYFCRLLNLLMFDCLIEYCISYFYWIVSFGFDSIWTDHSLQFYQNWPRLPHCHEVKFGRHTCIQCGKLQVSSIVHCSPWTCIFFTFRMYGCGIFLMTLKMIVMLKKHVHLIAFQLLENFILSWLSFKCAFFHSTVELKFLKITSNESSIIFYLTSLRDIYHTLVSSLQCFPFLIETSPEYIVDWNITNCFHFFNSNPPLLPKVLVDRPENYNIHYISIL